ncbi:ciliary microtubule-associated protein 2-like [Alosa pseudoharengus]|uniref:ciliary microtubule-associated protein 2-like n=1 Tax=Alosa pseudoharengus TaxID=34774 RepID=UPI003F8AEDFE
MAEKKFKGAPFGTQAARFDVSAVHPANKRVGTYTEIPYCKKMTSESERNLGPGTYNPDISDFGPRAIQERTKGPGWRRALEMARQAQMPGLLYREAWDNKHLLKAKVGPGTYKTTDFIEELNKKPGSIRGVCDSREERFPETREVGLSPGTYDMKGSIDLVLNSSTGKRGPYDLFTGPRNKPICSGYFAAPKIVNLQPGQYTKEMPRFGEDLEKPAKRKHGVFGTLEQYPAVPTDRIFHSTQSHCKRSATSPGPGWYEVTPVSRPGSRSAPPFLSSAPRVSKRAERLQMGGQHVSSPHRQKTVDIYKGAYMHVREGSFSLPLSL